MSEQTPTTSNPVAPPVPPVPQAEKPKTPWYKRKAIIIPAAVIVGIGVIGAIANPGGSDDVDASAPLTSSEDQAKPAAADEKPEMVIVDVPNVVGMTVGEARAVIEGAGFRFVTTNVDSDVVTGQDGQVPEGTDVKVTAETPDPTASWTIGQKNALSKAESYLRLMGFSREGLSEQLAFEEFTPEDSETAIVHLESTGGVDWNAEAAEKAQSYLDSMSFSRDGLYGQLEFEGFTPDQINHALTAVGY